MPSGISSTTCPPGGSTRDAGVCPRAKVKRSEWEEAFGKAVERSFEDVVRCVKSADAGRAVGGLSFALDVDPDGVVFNTRIVKGALPHISAQRFVLDALGGSGRRRRRTASSTGKDTASTSTDAT